MEYRSAAGSADYALLGSKSAKPQVIVEAKRLGTRLAKGAVSQGINYCQEVDVPQYFALSGRHSVGRCTRRFARCRWTRNRWSSRWTSMRPYRKRLACTHLALWRPSAVCRHDISRRVSQYRWHLSRLSPATSAAEPGCAETPYADRRGMVGTNSPNSSQQPGTMPSRRCCNSLMAAPELMNGLGRLHRRNWPLAAKTDHLTESPCQSVLPIRNSIHRKLTTSSEHQEELLGTDRKLGPGSLRQRTSPR